MANKPVNLVQALYQTGVLKDQGFFDTSAPLSNFTSTQQTRIERKYRENLFKRYFKSAPWKLDEYLGYDIAAGPREGMLRVNDVRELYVDDLVSYQASKGEFRVPWNAVEDWEGLRQVEAWEESKAAKRFAFGEISALQSKLRKVSKRSLLDSIWLYWDRASLNKKAAIGFGLGLGAFIAYNQFSGRDDRYNTIEGMPELGMASVLRKQNTPFGSGFAGEFAKIESVHDVLVDAPSRIASTISEVGSTISSIFSGTDDNSNAIEGMPEKGIAAKLRKQNTDFGSGYVGDKSNIRLYRGTKNYFAHDLYHEPIWATVIKGSPQEKFEKLLEEVRLQHFPSRPSRLKSTFWTPSITNAARYTRALSSVSRPVISQISRPISETFFASQDIYQKFGNAFISNNIEEARSLAHEYWKGYSVEEISKMTSKELMNVESIVPGITRATKQWGVNRRRVPKSEKGRDRYFRNVRPRWDKGLGLHPSNEEVLRFIHPPKPVNPSSVVTKTTIGNRLFSNVKANIISGLSEKGITSKIRKFFKFGSGWQGLRGPLLDVAKEFGRSVVAYKGTALTTGAVGLIYGWEKGKREGEIKWGQFASLMAIDMADDAIIFGSIVAAQRFPGLEKIRPYIEHPYVKQAGMGLFGFTVGKLTGEIGANLFSGYDNHYNVIKGFGETGIGAQLRKIYTDFGSGYQGQKENNGHTGWIVGGLIAGGAILGIYGAPKVLRQFLRNRTITNTVSSKVAGLVEPVKYSGRLAGFSRAQIEELAQYARKDSPTEFLRRLGVGESEHPHVLSGGGAGWATEPVGKLVSKIRLPDYTYEQISQIVFEETGLAPGTAVVPPLQRGGSFQSLQRMIGHLKREITDNELIQSGIATKDTLPQVREAIKSAHSFLRNFSEEEVSLFNKGVAFHEKTELATSSSFAEDVIGKIYEAERMPQHKIAVAQEEYFFRHLGNQKIYDAFKHLRTVTDNWFTGYGRGYNTIEGLRHGGLSAELRKILTDFGSGYDRVKALAKMAGIPFEKFLESNIFKSALESSTVVRSLGKGVWGEAFLRETKVMGETLQFVEKKMLPENIGTVQTVRGLAGEKATVTGMEWETEVLRRMEGAPAAPSLYRSSQDSILMEYMPGDSLKEMASRNAGFNFSQLPGGAKKELEETAKIAAERGLLNVDIHSGNILFHQETGRASWIDWGSVVKSEGKKEKALDLMLQGLQVRKATSTVNFLRPISGRIQSNISGNVIEGLSDTGTAKFSRDIHTDFGIYSKFGWKGLFGGVSRRISKYLASGVKVGAEELLNPQVAAGLARGKTFEQFAKSVGVEAKVYSTANAEEKWQGLISGFRSMGAEGEGTAKALEAGAATIFDKAKGTHTIFMHPERLRTAFVQQAERFGMSKDAALKAVQHEDFLKTVYYHEVLERQSAGLFSKLRTMPAQHAASQVVVGEGGFLQHIENQDVKQLFTTVRKGRKEELAALHAGFEAFSQGASPKLTQVTVGFGQLENRAATKLTESAQDLRITQEAVWSGAVDGGKRHGRFGAHPVRQQSKHGGNI